MSGEDPNIRSIFCEALERRNAEDRKAYLDSACGRNVEVRARIEELLAAHDDAGEFLEGNLARPALGATVIPLQTAEAPGTIIGPYSLLEQIGEGGFGIVYMADQQVPVRRRVAIKIIKPGMDSKQVLTRFEAERHVLAMMDHPNIARALDAGVTDSGRPYFVMELVRGVPITDYCDQHNLNVRDRLDLFVTVCHAVQHAHQKGIIHRDIKPSNVLVSMSDGRPIPKVIDFGVAKAINQQLTQETIFTRFAEMIGTPLYMSPEQAEMSSFDIDTRSDIYSLGVLLYELLTGTTPFEKERLKKAEFDEIRRIIREEEPVKPSTRISTLGDKSASVSAHRHVDPRRLSQIMRGDLDWIVMKALEKDRTRRYETANGLAMDIQRHLADEPVSAGPPSAMYRFRKFARRNKAALGMTAVVALALLLVIAGTAWQSYQTMQERDRAVIAEGKAEYQRELAERNFRKAREAVDEYFNKVSENRLLDMPGLEPLRKELLESALKYYETFAEQHKDDPERLADLAVAHLRLSQIKYWNGDHAAQYFPQFLKGVEILEQFVREGRDTPEVQRRFVGCFRINTEVRSFQSGAAFDRKLLLGCAARIPPILEKFVQDNPDVPEFRDDLAAAYMYVAMNFINSGKYAECALSAIRTTDILEKLTQEYPHEPRYRRDLAFAYEAKGRLFLSTGQRNTANEEFLKSLQLRELLFREFPHVVGYRSQLGSIYGLLADSADNVADAELNARKSVSEYEKVSAEFPTLWACRKDLALAYLKLGDTTKLRGNHVDALNLYRKGVNNLEVVILESEVYWRDARTLSDARDKLVKLLQQNGQQQEAENVYRQSFARIEKVVAANPNVEHFASLLTDVCRNLNSLLGDAGRLNEAAASSQQGVAVFEKLAADFPQNLAFQLELAICHEELAKILRKAGELAESERSYRKALALKEKLVAAAPAITDYRNQLGRTYLGLRLLLIDTKRPEEADEANRKAVEFLSDDGVFLNRFAWEMATSLNANSCDPIAAVELAKKAVDLAPRSGIVWNTLGVAHYRAGDWQAAITTLNNAKVLMSGTMDSYNTFFLAMAHWQLGQRDEAVKYYEQAIAWMEQNAAWIDANPAKDEELKRFRAEAAELLGMKSATEPTLPAYVKQPVEAKRP